jgi:lantibiotic leader peptide-processing serine protease
VLVRTKAIVVAALMLATGTSAGAPLPSGPAKATPTTPRRFVVLYGEGVARAEARTALTALGATILEENDAIGLATVRAPNPGFIDRAMATGAFFGIARDRTIGIMRGPGTKDVKAPRRVRSAPAARAPESPAASSSDPLYKYEWNMRMIHATPKGSYSKDRGDRRVLVGIMDTGIDLKNPDVRGHVDKKLSRSFLGKLPPKRDHCKNHPDTRYCDDSPFTDTLGHGTGVASLVGGRINGKGMSGVAPNVTLVSLRISRYWVFLQPVVDALTYAADHDIDVVNMSFFVDPWLFNCPDNPADTERQQMEQRTIVQAVQEAVDYARAHSVTPITALGNEALDLGKPKVDTISPDYPAGKAYRRDVDNSCLVVPQETDGVVGVSALGPSKRKAYYSDWGIERTDVSAPGGDDFDKARRYPANEVLVATSKISLRKAGLIDDEGKPKSRSILRRCRPSGRCAYWRFWQGTSFASPTAAGVAALIIGSEGDADGAGGISMDPAAVETKLFDSATHHRCPKGGVQRYKGLGRRYRAKCEKRSDGGNGFYGAGIVDALAALRK